MNINFRFGVFDDSRLFTGTGHADDNYTKSVSGDNYHAIKTDIQEIIEQEFVMYDEETPGTYYIHIGNPYWKTEETIRSFKKIPDSENLQDLGGYVIVVILKLKNTALGSEMKFIPQHSSEYLKLLSRVVQLI